jgi:hypothetical protein
VRDLDAAELAGRLFPGPLPLDAGPPVSGLLHTSAQVCAACHPAVVDQWSASGHAGTPSRALTEAAVGLPACLGCHRPLTSQSEVAVVHDAGRIDHPVARPSADFDATLAVEGVTCAACHVRGGAVVTGDAAAALRPAPHPMVYSDALGSSEGCAACHQLTWPGASEPLYDTYGEWKRSGLAELSISCLDCHVYGGVDGADGSDHTLRLDPARALTVQLSTPTLALTRGGPPIPATLSLTNTGSGHHFPTGSPYRAVRVRVTLESPTGEVLRELHTAELARRIEPSPPFTTTADTRLAAGEGRRFDLSLAVPLDAPAGEWTLRVALSRTVSGLPSDGPPLLVRAWPVHVE